MQVISPPGEPKQQERLQRQYQENIHFVLRRLEASGIETLRPLVRDYLEMSNPGLASLFTTTLGFMNGDVILALEAVQAQANVQKEWSEQYDKLKQAYADLKKANAQQVYTILKLQRQLQLAGVKLEAVDTDDDDVVRPVALPVAADAQNHDGKNTNDSEKENQAVVASAENLTPI